MNKTITGQALPGIKALKKILSSCAPDVKKPGPWRIIAQTGEPRYYMLRAVELLRCADDTQDLVYMIKTAISHLALAAYYAGEPSGCTQPKADPGTGSRTPDSNNQDAGV